MRKLLCKKCAEAFTLHPEDERAGFKMRKVDIICKRPPQLLIKITSGPLTKTIDVPVMGCDSCDEKLPDGTACVAVTMWGPEQQEPPAWEKDYSQ